MLQELDIPPADPSPLPEQGGDSSLSVDPEPISPEEAAALRESGDFFWTGELQLTFIIFVFALVAMAFFYFLQKQEKTTPYTLRIYVIIILVFGTLLIVSSSYSTSQIAPVVGFFGTIAGYLVGRNEKNEAS